MGKQGKETQNDGWGLTNDQAHKKMKTSRSKLRGIAPSQINHYPSLLRKNGLKNRNLRSSFSRVEEELVAFSRVAC